jgi:hypothetical protein
MMALPKAAQAEGGRLLRVLLIRRRALPARPRVGPVVLLKFLLGPDDGCGWHPDTIHIARLPRDSRPSHPLGPYLCGQRVGRDAKPQRPGKALAFGSVYYWSLGAAVVTASALAFMRWAEDYPLFLLGALSFATAYPPATHSAAAGTAGRACT